MILVYVQAQGTLNSADLAAVQAALSIAPVTLFVVGDEAAAKEGARLNVSEVLWWDTDTRAPEPIARALTQTAQDFEWVLAAGNAQGKNVLPRVAALLDVEMISDVVEIIDARTFVRPIYAGNALLTLKTCAPKVVLTVRASAFDKATYTQEIAKITPLTVDVEGVQSHFVTEALTQSESPDLSFASCVVAGGRGLGSKAQFDALLTPLAAKLGAAIGASRVAVDEGFAPNDWQVGQTGKIIAPDLYIAAGISGAIQHLAGISGAKTIVAINQDPESALAKMADYYWQEDVALALPQLTQNL